MDKNITYSSFLFNKKKDKNNVFEIYKNSNILLNTYSRIALFQILKLHNKKEIQNIYMPSLICRDLLSAIHNLNYKIHYYDVDKKLNPIFSDNIKIDIIIIVNYFGFSQNLTNFTNYINNNKCITIEDNSHGFLSKDSDGLFLGTRLNYGFISIYKSLNIFNGSILINNTKNTFKEKKLIRKFNLSYNLKRFIYFTIFNSPNINFKIFNFIKLIKKLINFNKSKINIDEFNLPNDKIIYENINLKFMPFDYIKEISRRRNTYLFIDNLLKNEKIKPIFSKLDENTVPYCYPFYCESHNLKKLHKILSQYNFIIVKWPELPSEIKTKPNFYDKLYFITFKI